MSESHGSDSLGAAAGGPAPADAVAPGILGRRHPFALWLGPGTRRGGFACLALDQGGRRLGGAALSALVHEIGPHAPDGSYARVSLDTGRPAPGPGAAPPDARRRTPRFVLEWGRSAADARDGRRPLLARLRVFDEGVVEWHLRGPPGIAARYVDLDGLLLAELPGSGDDGPLHLALGVPEEAATDHDAEGAGVSFSVRSGDSLHLALVAHADRDVAMVAAEALRHPRHVDARLADAAGHFARERACVLGAWDGLHSLLGDGGLALLQRDPASGALVLDGLEDEPLLAATLLAPLAPAAAQAVLAAAGPGSRGRSRRLPAALAGYFLAKLGLRLGDAALLREAASVRRRPEEAQAFADLLAGEAGRAPRADPVLRWLRVQALRGAGRCEEASGLVAGEVARLLADWRARAAFRVPGPAGDGPGAAGTGAAGAPRQAVALFGALAGLEEFLDTDPDAGIVAGAASARSASEARRLRLGGGGPDGGEWNVTLDPGGVRVRRDGRLVLERAGPGREAVWAQP